MVGWLFRRGHPPAPLVPQDAYALWAPTYPARPHNALMRVEQAAVESVLPDLRGRAVLDAGCGTGRYLRLLRARGAARVVGVDRSRAMLDRAREECPNLVEGELSALPLASGSVDVVVCGLALNDVGDLNVVVAELTRVLVAGGHLVYSVVHPSGGSLGWARTFDTSSGPRAVSTYWHPRSAHERACATARLQIDDIREPALDEPGSAQGPVAMVVHASRA